MDNKRKSSEEKDLARIILLTAIANLIDSLIELLNHFIEKIP